MATAKKRGTGRNTTSGSDTEGLKTIRIQGFKSIRTERVLELGSLNILSGSNSSGKSSFMQPLLLLKQTFEAPYDPGPLLIDGPNVKFTELAQIFSKPNPRKEFVIGLGGNDGSDLELHFELDAKKQLKIKKNKRVSPAGETEVFSEGMTPEELRKLPSFREFGRAPKSMQPTLTRERAYLRPALMDGDRKYSIPWTSRTSAEQAARNLIHVPGLRGNPERSYKKSAIGSNFPGTMDTYVASIISEWQDKSDPRLIKLGQHLQQLGLTWKVSSRKVDDTRVELQVGRLPAATQGGAHDLVSIADVGFGVSQVLPVLVALLVARVGQIVYVEQPETHLHPRAQRELARIFADAVSRKAIVVVETHSLLFIRTIQTLVAEKFLSKDLVKMHWVQRDVKGDTSVITADLDDSGAYGNWPQDFEQNELSAEQDYVDAAERVILEG